MSHSFTDKFGRFLRVDENGKRHCPDGPAMVNRDGYGSWYWHGETFNKIMFSDDWSDEKKAWWMRAKLSSNNP